MYQPLTVIPQPQRVMPGSGEFALDAATRIMAAPGAEAAANLLADLLRPASGLPLPVEMGADLAPNLIFLSLSGAEAELGTAGYGLDVTPNHAVLRANSAAGLLNGVQTVRQLLPAEVERRQAVEGVRWAMPAVHIEDWPCYGWRGLHLDVGRHMFPVAFVKKFLDVMALHKFNVFHWHLTEDQGWRIEIKQYPRLTEVGSQRAASPYPHDRKTLDGKPHGGFYTQDEVREVVAYAARLGITVLPEIEMPGHAVAALTSYPGLGCVGQGYEVRQFWGIADDVFCAGNEDVYTFLENVLTEVFALFPSEYIHIGGDECPKVRWKACPKCQAAIQREGLADEHALQSYFVQRMERFINAHGRRLIGWDEILEGGLAPNATVMSWRGSKGGIQAATAGHDVVMTPNTHCYLDYYQTEDREGEPPAIGGYIPLAKAYAFDPTEGIPADKHGHVLGGQGNIWTEYMPTETQVEYMTYPRASALAEALWTACPERDYADFCRRMRALVGRLESHNIHYRDPFSKSDGCGS